MEAIDTRLEALDVFHAAGLRSLGPVWSRPNAFAHGVPFDFPRGPDTGPGLTAAGKRLVQACNRLGVLVDLSHLNEAGFWDVARISDAPLVATHSCAWALASSPRNLTDAQLDAIRASGGIVGINFHKGFLRADGDADRADVAHGDRAPRALRRRPDRRGARGAGVGLRRRQDARATWATSPASRGSWKRCAPPASTRRDVRAHRPRELGARPGGDVGRA